MIPQAFNYDPYATIDANNCIDSILSCANSLALNYESSANTNIRECIYPVVGCTDEDAINFNINANTDDGTCKLSCLKRKWAQSFVQTDYPWQWNTLL